MIIALSGCAATASSVESHQAAPTVGTGIVLGKFGVPPAEGRGANSRKMTVVNLANKQEWAIPFREGESDDDSRSAPFLIELPGGKYQITAWEISFMDLQLMQANAFVTFEVVPGQITCIGGLYPIRDARRWRSVAAQWTLFRVSLLPHDDCAGLASFRQSAAPKLALATTTKLASNILCPACRADLVVHDPSSPAPAPGTAPHAGTVSLPVLTAETHRLGDRSPIKIGWPQDPTINAAVIRLRVCVSTGGVPDQVTVVTSAHPTLDEQLVGAARAWRYTVYLLAGKPTPFCYEPEFALSRS